MCFLVRLSNVWGLLQHDQQHGHGLVGLPAICFRAKTVGTADVANPIVAGVWRSIGSSELFGYTKIVLHLSHRQSVDFELFS